MSSSAHFFLGANSGLGFQSLYEPFCAPENFRDLAIIKAGPGGGKSTLMRRVAEAMEAEGERVEYLHCSGDPDSLDGVHIPRLHAAIVDGTAPHVLEPKYHNAVERYLDVGRCCDLDMARAARGEIVRCSAANAAAYRRAYRAMSAARQLRESAETLAAEGFDGGKLLKRVRGIARRELRGKGPGASEELRYLGSLTCKGPVWRFDSLEALCPRVYVFQDTYGLAAPALELLRDAALEQGYRAVVCPSPEHADRVEHLLLPEPGVAFVTSREDMDYTGAACRRIRVDSLTAPECRKRFRGRLKLLRRMARAMDAEAVEALRDAKAAHDELERAYRPAIDTGALDDLAAEEIGRFRRML